MNKCRPIQDVFCSIMKITLTQVLLMVILTSLVSAGHLNGQGILDRRVSLDAENTTIKAILTEIEKQTSVVFTYRSKLIDDSRKVTFKMTDAKLAEVLEQLFGANISFLPVNEEEEVVLRPAPKYTSLESLPLSAEVFDLAVSGKISDETGQPLPGVNVVEKGTSNGTTTDASGLFSLNVQDERSVLVFSFIGYTTQEITVGNQTTISLSLQQDMKALDEVVVVGYGTQKKVNLTGAVDVISRKSLENRAPANVGSLLQGVSPNLNISVTQFGGEPGAGNSFNIRGVGSLTGGGPLILVDGVEMNINNLDPESVESVSVLKDAASAAIYGSRAPFGVILITTKKGTKDRGVSVTYSNNIASASPMYLPEWQSSLRYVTAYNQSLQNSGQPDKFGPAQIDRIKRYMAGTYLPEYDTAAPPNSIWAGRHEGNANYEWWDEYFRDHTTNQKHNINVSGGDDKTQYYVSTGLYDQGTSYNWVDEYYRRYNILANITSQATPWLRLNVNTKYANSRQSHPNYSSTDDGGRNFIISEIIKFFPTTTKYNWNGTLNNPYMNQIMKGGLEKYSENDLFLSLGGELEPIKGWKTNVNYYYNYTGSTDTKHDKAIFVEIPTGEVVNNGADPNGFVQNWMSNNYKSLQAFTSYEKTFSDHSIKAMVGYERESKYFSTLYAQRSELLSDEVPAINTATGVSNVGDAMSHWATEAFFGRLNYNYQEKYLFEVNGRYNGSSRFAKESRWGFFPSVSAGYNISKEPFWEPLQQYVGNLKIRGSYGSLGNQNTGGNQNVSNYLYLSNMVINPSLEAIIDGKRPNYANIPAIISPDLTWETVTTLNFGIDATFLRDRLGVEFDVFKRNTTDMFGPAAILPNSLGTNPPRQNNAALETKGWELSLDWNDNIKNEFDYSLKLILADSRSFVTEYLNETGQIDQFYVGKEIGEIWGYTTAGLIQSDTETIPDQSKFYNKWGAGDIKYTDLNGDNKIDDGTRTLANHGDLKVIGNTSPRYTLGFSGTMAWKNFDFSMFWQGIMKRSHMPGSNIWWGIATRGNNGGAFYDGHDDYWRPANETNLFGPNTDAYYAKPYVSSETLKNQQAQTRYLQDAGYFRLKNIQLGYTIPQGLSDRLKIQSLRVYVSGENLVTFSKMTKLLDPETSFTYEWMQGAIYPLSKSYSAGLNLTF
jgi:TonB-linked SusC/RagA family outer membrane protein